MLQDNALYKFNIDIDRQTDRGEKHNLLHSMEVNDLNDTHRSDELTINVLLFTAHYSRLLAELPGVRPVSGSKLLEIVVVIFY